MATRLGWPFLLLALSVSPALACTWRIAQDDAGFFEIINTTANTEHYFYALVVPFRQPITTLEDLKRHAISLERSAERRKYAMPPALRHGRVYLMSSSTRLNLEDRFRIVPVFKPAGLPPSNPVLHSPSKGMNNYGGPLPSPRFEIPEGDWPRDATVCTTRW